MSDNKIQTSDFLQSVKSRNPHQPEFHQAIEEVIYDLAPLVNDTARYRKANLLERLTEPDRIVSFRITWVDDSGRVRVNRGYRVQFNSAIGPYKGGIRFHPTVNESILKFLAFEQTFKNALTGLPMGGGKGGADFDPRGCSDTEIMRFCQAFMLELYRHIQPDIDVPAGDINVGSREIGYLFGMYKKITNQFEGVLTGKGLSYGGSKLRVEATGYGLVTFVQRILDHHSQELDGKTIAISGAGNVATHAAEKALTLGAKVLTLSDSSGTIFDEDGIDQEKLDWIKAHKAKADTSLSAYVDEFGGKWQPDENPWQVPCDIALPCATQNELDDKDAKYLVKNGCQLIAEGANMPVTMAGKKVIDEAGILFAPAKAANAGGVAMSGLEITQNRTRRAWTRDSLDKELEAIMHRIHDDCLEHGRDKDRVNYAKGANIAGFIKVADAMLAQGII